MSYKFKCQSCGYDFDAKAPNAKYCPKIECQRMRKRLSATERKKNNCNENAVQVAAKMVVPKVVAVAPVSKRADLSKLEQMLELQNKQIETLLEKVTHQSKINSVLIKKIKERESESGVIKQKLFETRECMAKLEAKFLGQQFSYRFDRETGDL